jgi:hypothetical protein
MDNATFLQFLVGFSKSLTPSISVKKIYYHVNKIFTLIKLFYLNCLNRIRRVILTAISMHGNPCVTPIARKYISLRFRSLGLLRVRFPAVGSNNQLLHLPTSLEN